MPLVANVIPFRRPSRPTPPADPSAPVGRRFDLRDGSRTYALVGGRSDGVPTLLLHGLGATAALNWSTCLDALGQLGPVVAPDHRGHGRGARVGDRFSLEQCADDAADVLRQLGTGPAVVVGYSMGGPIAQLLARRHPDLVAGLVLCATARDFRGAPADRLRFAALAAFAPAAAILPSVEKLPVPPLPGHLSRLSWALDEARRHEPSALVAAARALGRFTSRRWIGQLRVPATVLVHTEDRVVPPHRQRKLAASLRDATMVEVPGDHLAVGNDPERYLPALLRAHASVRHRAGARTTAA